MEDAISTIDAARILGISPRQAARLAEDGKIEARKVGRPWIFSRASVLRYKAAKEAESNEDSTPGNRRLK